MTKSIKVILLIKELILLAVVSLPLNIRDYGNIVLCVFRIKYTPFNARERW